MLANGNQKSANEIALLRRYYSMSIDPEIPNNHVVICKNKYQMLFILLLCFQTYFGKITIGKTCNFPAYI